ncbi:MAG: hypothetical protein Q9181_004037 [Wetmoreana brouardii]
MEGQGLLTSDKAAGNEAGSSTSYGDSLDHHTDNKDAYVELNGVFAGEDLCEEAAIQTAEPGTKLEDGCKPALLTIPKNHFDSFALAPWQDGRWTSDADAQTGCGVESSKPQPESRAATLCRLLVEGSDMTGESFVRTTNGRSVRLNLMNWTDVI